MGFISEQSPRCCWASSNRNQSIQLISKFYCTLEGNKCFGGKIEYKEKEELVGKSFSFKYGRVRLICVPSVQLCKAQAQKVWGSIHIILKFLIILSLCLIPTLQVDVTSVSCHLHLGIQVDRSCLCVYMIKPMFNFWCTLAEFFIDQSKSHDHI